MINRTDIINFLPANRPQIHVIFRSLVWPKRTAQARFTRCLDEVIKMAIKSAKRWHHNRTRRGQCVINCKKLASVYTFLPKIYINIPPKFWNILLDRYCSKAVAVSVIACIWIFLKLGLFFFYLLFFLDIHQKDSSSDWWTFLYLDDNMIIRIYISITGTN